MEGPPDERAPKIEDVYALVREIERRVTALERDRQAVAGPIEDASLTRTASTPSGGEIALPSVPEGIIPVLGKALLGIAGAYLLRAAAETGTLPQWAAVLAALVYAAWWLISSSRIAPPNRFTTAVYAMTSALVVAPMLWETTVRFQVLSPAITATVLIAFIAVAAALAWQRDVAAIPWITTLAAVATAIALIVATHQVVPFTIALLTIAGIAEFAACRNHWLGERWLAAAAADFAVFLLAYLVTRPNGVPEGYPPLATSTVLAVEILLLPIYLGSTGYRTLLHGLDITALEIGQAALAFLISIGGALSVTQGAAPARAAAGAFALLSGAACYVVAFVFLERKSERHRNFYTYSAFGLALTLTGCYVLLAGAALVTAFSALGAAGMWTAVAVNRTSLRLHAVAYVLAAAGAANLIGFGYDRIIGAAMPWPAPGVAVMLAVASAGWCYAFGRRNDSAAGRVAAALLGAILCWAVLAVIAGAAGPAGASAVATVRTGAVCLLSALLAWAGARWNRQELKWLLYPLMIGGGIKLAAEDFRIGNTVTMCISLLFFGGTLTLLPRLARATRRYSAREPAIEAGLAQARRTT